MPDDALAVYETRWSCMMMLRGTAGSLLTLLCLGCMPMSVTRSPGVSGVVVDADSGRPVQGAEVFVARATPGSADASGGSRSPVVKSGADGTFAVPRQSRWIVVYSGMDRPPPSGTLVVRRPGYESVSRDVSGRSQDVGTIPLTPVR